MELHELFKMSPEEIRKEALKLPGAYDPAQTEEATTSIRPGNIIVPGTIPLVLMAHIDTVYLQGAPTKIVKNGLKTQTPIGSGIGIGGDDRCGCWCLFQAAQWEFMPTLIFCDDEETCNGSSVGLNTLDWSDYKAFIEVDGPGFGVFYSNTRTSNNVLDTFLEDEIGLLQQTTAYNDIVEVAKPGNPPGVTLGGAYYDQHSARNEWVNEFGLGVVVETIKQIIANLDKLKWSVLEEQKPYPGQGWAKGGYQNYGKPYGSETRSTGVTTKGATQKKELPATTAAIKIEADESGENQGSNIQMGYKDNAWGEYEDEWNEYNQEYEDWWNSQVDPFGVGDYYQLPKAEIHFMQNGELYIPVDATQDDLDSFLDSLENMKNYTEWE